MLERYALSPMRELWSPEAQYERWLRVELAALAALEGLGVVPAGTTAEVRARARIDVGRIREIERDIGHDLLAFLWALEEEVGAAGRWIHYGLTSSDVKDTALSLLLRDALGIVLDKAGALAEALREFAERHRETPMVGRTHGQYAEPTTLGLKALCWWAELGRDIARLERAREAISVGKLAGAVGTYPYFPPEAEERALAELGLAPARPTTQVIPRDRYADVLFALAQTGSLVEKVALEVRHLSRSEVAEVAEGRPEGSSAMPHKRNPILSERLCGLARLLRATVSPALEDNALWHERDMSHSSVERIILPQAFILVDYMLVKCRELIRSLRVYPERMLGRILDSRGIVFSEGLLLALVRAGLSRRAAHAHVARLVAEAERAGRDLKEIALGDATVRERLTPEEIEGIFDLRTTLREVGRIFASAPGGPQGRTRSEK
ncbi:MAG: adenylosuccinate lyase [Caldiserica bacterium]|nr:adenylosuccinate lyase [Caldisericota bacterium]